VILRVDLEMLGEVIDPLGEQGDLNLVDPVSFSFIWKPLIIVSFCSLVNDILFSLSHRQVKAMYFTCLRSVFPFDPFRPMDTVITSFQSSP
jgi:hypothetical protein